MIKLTTDTTGNEQMVFLNGTSSLLPTTPGLYISSSACGSGKTILIAEIAMKHYDEGVLIVVPTIADGDAMLKKLDLDINDVFLLHSDNKENMRIYANTPEELANHSTLIITSARPIIDPIDLFLNYNGKQRKWVLVDELIDFFPRPFDIPDDIADIVTNVDTTDENSIKNIEVNGKKYYQHLHTDLNTMKAAVRLSNKNWYGAKETKLKEHKTDTMLKHILSNGLTPINQNFILSAAESSIVICFDGTADVLFEGDKRLLPLNGDRYCSDISFAPPIPLPIKRKNGKDFNIENLNNYTADFLNWVVDKTKTEKLLIVTWKTLDTFKDLGDNDDVEEKLTKVSYDFPDRLKALLIEKGAVVDNLAVIYRGSGLDRGSNKYKDFDSCLFLGEWRIPDTITKDLSNFYGCKINFHEYKKALLIQTICRLRIRKHEGAPIKVYFTKDCNYELFSEVQEYFKLNSPSTCNISGLLKPCPTYTLPQKGYMVDVVMLYAYDQNLRNATLNKTPYQFSITLDKIHSLLPRPQKKASSYAKLKQFLSTLNVTMTITSQEPPSA